MKIIKTNFFEKSKIVAMSKNDMKSTIGGDGEMYDKNGQIISLYPPRTSGKG